MRVHVCSLDRVLGSTPIADPEPTFDLTGTPAMVFHSVTMRAQAKGEALLAVLTLRGKPWAVVRLECLKVRRGDEITLTDITMTFDQDLGDMPPEVIEQLPSVVPALERAE